MILLRLKGGEDKMFIDQRLSLLYLSLDG
jgi:hypothetical protein